ncbi:MAG: hypothetical protein GY759_09775 [Chloroflexi bacterium]|nr:hypothetical protein [Chloroflexota bacterium]
MMKTVLIGCAYLVLILLIGTMLSSWKDQAEQCHVGQASMATPVVSGQMMVIWAEWIGSGQGRRRPYINPLRRYRLSKKQRKGLRRQLSRVLTSEAEQFKEEGDVFSEGCSCAGRWG